MKLETTAGALKAALMTVKPAVTRRSTIPVLASVLLQDGAVTATDLDMMLTAAMAVTRHEGAACIAFAPLLALVRSLPADESLAITTGDAAGATVVFSAGRAVLPAMAPADFPLLEMGETDAVAVDGDALKRGLAFVLPFVSTEEIRYYLNGVCLDADHVVATNGHSLGAFRHGFDGGPLGRLILPAALARVLAAMPPVSELHFTPVGRRLVRAAGGGVCVVGKTIDGTFPEWPRVVPRFDGVFSALSLDRASLLTTLRRFKDVSGRKHPLVSLAWRGGTVAGALIDDEMALAQRLAADAHGAPDGRAAYNANYLAAALGRFHAETVRMQVLDSGAPTLLSTDDSAFAVVMPVRVRPGDDLALQALEDAA